MLSSNKVSPEVAAETEVEKMAEMTEKKADDSVEESSVVAF